MNLSRKIGIQPRIASGDFDVHEATLCRRPRLGVFVTSTKLLHRLFEGFDGYLIFGAVHKFAKWPNSMVVTKARKPMQSLLFDVVLTGWRWPDRGEGLRPGQETMRGLGRAFGGGVAPGAGVGGADGADLEPVLGAARQARDGAAQGFADVALRPGSTGR